MNCGKAPNHPGESSSSSVFRLVATIQMNGSRKIPTHVSKARCSQPRRMTYRASRGIGTDALRSLIVHPLSAQPELKKCERQNDQEQNPRHRAGVAHVEKLKRLVEQVVRVKQR